MFQVKQDNYKAIFSPRVFEEAYFVRAAKVYTVESYTSCSFSEHFYPTRNQKLFTTIAWNFSNDGEWCIPSASLLNDFLVCSAEHEGQYLMSSVMHAVVSPLFSLRIIPPLEKCSSCLNSFSDSTPFFPEWLGNYWLGSFKFVFLKKCHVHGTNAMRPAVSGFPLSSDCFLRFIHV